MKQLLLTFTLSILFLSACTGGKRSDTTSLGQASFQTLNLGIMPTMDGLPFVIAKKKGIYDSLGLDVNLVRFNSSNDQDASFQSGLIDGAVTDYPSAATLQAHHTNLRIVMKNNGYSCFIVSRQSGINNRNQLKNKNIAVSRNTVAEYATDLLLEKAGISMTEVNKPEIGQIPLCLQMLQYGQIDASFLPDPLASIAMNGGNKSLVSTQELNVNFAGTAFSQKALTEKSEEIKLLITGYNLAVEYIKTHSQKEWKQLLIEEFGVPEALTGLIALPLYEPAARPSEKDIARAVSWLKAHKRIPAAYQEQNLIDTTFTTTTKSL